jgi:hypothetical protein
LQETAAHFAQPLLVDLVFGRVFQFRELHLGSAVELVVLVPPTLNSGGISRALFRLSFVASQSRSFGYASSSRLG